jgi:thiol-disulfide isomerase/thioredoxin
MRSGLRLPLLLALCAAAGFFVGRAFWTGLPTPPSGADAAPPAHVPAFQLRDLSGAQRDIREWSSQVLIINFWATWCAPCRKEMPLLEALHQERSAEGLAIVGIAIDDEDPVRAFIGETGVTYTILVGQQEAMAVAESFKPGWVGLPMTVIAAPGGEILKLHVGELHPEDLVGIVTVLDRLRSGEMSVAEARKALQKV